MPELRSWQLQPAALCHLPPDSLSTPGADLPGWHRSPVRRTALCALTHDGTYPDVRVWPNAFQVPDSSDVFNERHELSRFSHLPDGRNPWREAWWYRAEFELPRLESGQRVWLHLDSINYRADIWVNGGQVAGREAIVGMFRRWRLDVTARARVGANAVALRIHPVDHPGEPEAQLEVFGGVRPFHTELCNDVTEIMSVGYDCFPTVPDRNLGLVQEVRVEVTGPVDLRHAFVRAELDLPELDPARLTVTVEALNTSADILRGVLRGVVRDPAGAEVGGFSRAVTLLGHETKELTVGPTDGELTLAAPRLWWPNTYGDQPLYDLALTFTPDAGPATSLATRFGIRRLDWELHEVDDAHGRRLYVNGERIFQRGGYVQPEMMFDWDRARVADELQYLAHANLNYVVFEDIPNPPDWYLDLCDELGLMFWNCYYGCYWLQYNRPWNIDTAALEEATVDLCRRYRNHASLTINMAQNEGETREDVYEMWRRTMLRYDPDRALLPSGSFPCYREGSPAWFERERPVGCNDYQPKTYSWQLPEAYYRLVREHRNWMFMIESGSASLPPLESLLRFLPQLAELGENPGDDPKWPLDEAWAHYGANRYYEWYHRGLHLMYGAPTDLRDYLRKAHLVTYDQHRALFEAVHHRMWDLTSGFGEWKINSGFPDVQWQLYDWYLRPMVSLYAVRKACARLAIQLSPVDGLVTAINSGLAASPGLTASAVAYDAGMNVRVERSERVELPANAATDLFPLDVPDLPLVFVKLELRDGAAVVADNFYWLSIRLREVELQFEPDEWRKWPAMSPMLLPKETPVLPELADLPPAQVALSATLDGRTVRVDLRNEGTALAFFLRARVLRDGEELLPVRWSDNYISLLPGETKRLTAEVPEAEGRLRVAVDGWNVAEESVGVRLDR